MPYCWLRRSTASGGCRSSQCPAREAGQADWRPVGRVAVRAKTKSREQQLVRQVVGALRSAEAPGISFWVRPTSASRVIERSRAALASYAAASERQ